MQSQNYENYFDPKNNENTVEEIQIHISPILSKDFLILMIGHIQQAHTANEENKLRCETREIFEINVKRHISYYIDKAYFNSFTVHD